MEKGIIYSAVNQINDKVYIGQTTKSLEKRRQTHFNTSRKSNFYFHNALKKYGAKNFIFQEICIIETRNKMILKEYLDIAEKIFIEQYNSFEEGYNLTKGGSGPLGMNHSIKTRHKMSIVRKGKNHPQFGKPRSDETKKKISNANKGKKHYFYGKKFSKEHRENISKGNTGKKMSEKSKRKNSESKKGKKNPMAKKIVNLDTGEIFNTQKEAGEFHNIKSYSNISNCCIRRQQTCGGYRWSFVDEDGSFETYAKKRRYHIKKVRNIDTQEVFKSSIEAEKKYSIYLSGVGRCCRGDRETAGGYKWEYVND